MSEASAGSDPRGSGRTTAVILCGGAGRRAGGADKPLFEYQGKELVAHVVDSTANLAVRTLISANRNFDEYRRHGETVADHRPLHQGPLAGIDACLQRIDGGFVIVCPGDAPLVRERLWRRLLAALRDGRAAAVCAHDGQRRQPLFLALDLAALVDRPAASLPRYLADGGRSVHGWLDGLGALDVDCSDLSYMLIDIDDREALDRLNATQARSPGDS